MRRLRDRPVAALAGAAALALGLPVLRAQDRAPPTERALPGACRGWASGQRVRLVGTIGHPGFRHRGAVLALAFAPDGKRAASVDADGVLHAWDFATREELWALSGKRRPLAPATAAVVGFSSDGARVLATDEEGALVVADAATGALVRRLSPGGELPGRVLALAPDGSRALVRAQDSLVLADAVDGHEVKKLAPVEGALAVAAFSPDGKRAAVGGGEGTTGVLGVLDLETGAVLWSEARLLAPVASVAFSPDGKVLASAGGESAVRLRDAATGKPGEVLSAGDAPSRAVAFAGAGAGPGALVASADRALRVWDAATGKLAREVPIAGLAGLVAVSPDGTRALVAPLDDRTLVPFDLVKGHEIGEARAAHAGTVTALAVSRDGMRCVTAGGDGMLRDWAAGSGSTGRAARLFEPTPGHERGPTSVGHLAFADFFVAGSALAPGDDAVLLVRAHGDPRRLAGHAPAAVSGDGKAYVAAGAGTALEVRDVARDQVSATLTSHGGKPRFLALSQDGGRALLADEAGRLMLWNLKKGGGARLTEEGSAEVSALALAPDGKLALAGSRSGATVWDLEAQKPVASLLLADAPACAVALAPDGSLGAVACEDGTIRVFEAGTGKLVEAASSRPSLDVARAIAFVGPRTLLAGTERGVVLRFSVEAK